VAKPRLQFKQGHRPFGVVELTRNGGACAVAGDPTAGIGHRYTGLAAQKRDQRVIDVLGGNRPSTEAEQGGESLAGLAIDKQRLHRSTLFPASSELADQGIDRLGEAGTRLVNRHVNEARRVISGSVP
jgi:hypothetical protein